MAIVMVPIKGETCFMDKKRSVWQGVLIGAIITPICLHLKYPSNFIAVVLAILLLVISVIKDRKKYNKFSIAGMLSIIIGGIGVAFSTTGMVISVTSFEMQIFTSLGMIFLGITLIGVGNHIANPERVSKKKIYFVIAVSSFLLGCFLLLFEFGKYISRNAH